MELQPEDREAKLYLDEASRKWTMRHSPVTEVLWTFAINEPLELWIGGEWIFGYIDVSIPDNKPNYYFQAEKGGFCGLLNNMGVRIGKGMGWKPEMVNEQPAPGTKCIECGSPFVVSTPDGPKCRSCADGL